MSALLCLCRRSLFVGAAATVVMPRAAFAAAHSYEWDNGGANPLDVSIQDTTIHWGINRFYDRDPVKKRYFTEEWGKWRRFGFDPMLNSTVVPIKDGDQWQEQYFGGGSLVSNVVARPSVWKPHLSRWAIVLAYDDGHGNVEEFMVPQVCGNVTRRRRIIGQPDCIPQEALQNRRSISSLWRS